jgi:hypothetical protein
MVCWLISQEVEDVHSGAKIACQSFLRGGRRSESRTRKDHLRDYDKIACCDRPVPASMIMGCHLESPRESQ